MAIFGDNVWTGSVLTEDFLDIDLFNGIIFDTHFSERDREQRLKDFINQSSCTIGIGADENTAKHSTVYITAQRSTGTAVSVQVRAPVWKLKFRLSAIFQIK